MENDFSLILWDKETKLFTSRGKWLHPLFELEDYLCRRKDLKLENLLLEDKIIGKAAAVLAVRLGIRKIKAHLISELGKKYLEEKGINLSYINITDRIACRTEEILLEVSDPEEAYRELSKRAGRA